MSYDHGGLGAYQDDSDSHDIELTDIDEEAGSQLLIAPTAHDDEETAIEVNIAETVRVCAVILLVTGVVFMALEAFIIAILAVVSPKTLDAVALPYGFLFSLPPILATGSLLILVCVALIRCKNRVSLFLNLGCCNLRLYNREPFTWEQATTACRSGESQASQAITASSDSGSEEAQACQEEKSVSIICYSLCHIVNRDFSILKGLNNKSGPRDGLLQNEGGWLTISNLR